MSGPDYGMQELHEQRHADALEALVSVAWKMPEEAEALASHLGLTDELKKEMQHAN